MPNKTISLRCPVCALSLEANESGLVCQNRHSFDRAKEGYVNLVLANKKKSREPGDNKDMLQSRRRFLEAGYYRPLLEKLVDIIKSLSDDAVAVLDLGCGEGYFNAGLADKMPTHQFVGIDVSRDAVRMASKLSPELDYYVASNHDLPFADHQFDLLFSINAPTHSLEIKRVLKEGGFYIRVTPAAQHLFELKKLIYTEPRQHSEESLALDGLEFVRQEKIAFEIDVESTAVFDLLKMTPYYWHASEVSQKSIKAMPRLVTKAAFCIDIYRV